MKYLTKEFSKVNNYPIKTINKIIQLELNDNQKEDKTPDNNDTSTKIQLISSYSGKQGIEETYQRNLVERHTDDSDISN